MEGVMSRLTMSQENYLQIVLMLQKDKDGVRLTDVADRFSVSKASACIAITRLEKKGLVARNSDRLISLTPEGEREARRVASNFTLVYQVLTSCLNVDPHTALLDAGRLEHLTSAKTADALRSLLEQA
jgi:Mn-dependent DtxR family transcriptional regulator